MLSPQGLARAKYIEILQDETLAWEDFLKTHQVAAGAVDELIRNGVAADYFKMASFHESVDQQAAVRKALLILHTALGDQLLASFMQTAQIVTVAAALDLSVFPPAVEEINEHYPENMQIPVLCAVVTRLAWELSPKKPSEMLYTILNQISLPYSVHQAIIHQFQQQSTTMAGSYTLN